MKDVARPGETKAHANDAAGLGQPGLVGAGGGTTDLGDPWLVYGEGIRVRKTVQRQHEQKLLGDLMAGRFERNVQGQAT